MTDTKDKVTKKTVTKKKKTAKKAKKAPAAKKKKTTKTKAKAKTTAKRGRGRPTEHHTDKINLDQVEKAAMFGLRVEDIAAIIGDKPMSKKTFERMMHKRPEIFDAIERGRAKAQFEMGSRLYDLAMGKVEITETKAFAYQGIVSTKDVLKRYPPDVQAIQFYLRTQGGERWKEKTKVEHTGDSAVQKLAQMIDSMSDEEKEERLALLRQRRASLDE